MNLPAGGMFRLVGLLRLTRLDGRLAKSRASLLEVKKELEALKKADPRANRNVTQSAPQLSTVKSNMRDEQHTKRTYQSLESSTRLATASATLFRRLFSQGLSFVF